MRGADGCSPLLMGRRGPRQLSGGPDCGGETPRPQRPRPASTLSESRPCARARAAVSPEQRAQSCPGPGALRLNSAGCGRLCTRNPRHGDQDSEPSATLRQPPMGRVPVRDRPAALC